MDIFQESFRAQLIQNYKLAWLMRKILEKLESC